MYGLGLKCALDSEQFYERLKQKPRIIELHLNEEDLFGKRRSLLVQRIHECKELGIKVYLHHPIKYQGLEQDIISPDMERKGYYDLSTRILAGICQKEDIKCVIHPHYHNSVCTEMTPSNIQRVREEIIKILSYSGEVFLFENTIAGIFSSENENWVKEIVQPLRLPIVYDISHAFIALKGDNEKLQREMNEIAPNTKYFHVVDSMGTVHDGLELGAGKIEWEEILHHIENKPYIYEVLLRDVMNSGEMVASHEYVMNLNKKNAN